MSNWSCDSVSISMTEQVRGAFLVGEVPIGGILEPFRQAGPGGLSGVLQQTELQGMMPTRRSTAQAVLVRSWFLSGFECIRIVTVQHWLRPCPGGVLCMEVHLWSTYMGDAADGAGCPHLLPLKHWVTSCPDLLRTGFSWEPGNWLVSLPT